MRIWDAYGWLTLSGHEFVLATREWAVITKSAELADKLNS